jgi:hypothetical protein
MRRGICILVLVICLLLVGNALAMSSDNFGLDWFTPLTGGGGGEASSTNYAVNLTIGQTASGTSSSASYGSCLGYWCGATTEHRIYLPVMSRNH